MPTYENDMKYKSFFENKNFCKVKNAFSIVLFNIPIHYNAYYLTTLFA